MCRGPCSTCSSSAARRRGRNRRPRSLSWPRPRAAANGIQAARKCLAAGGAFIHSEWQFLNSTRWRGRIQPWELIGLEAGEVDTGDTLLDWRSGGHGLRYVHHFNEDELANLAGGSGFQVSETFYSDGEGGRLGLYQVWKAI